MWYSKYQRRNRRYRHHTRTRRQSYGYKGQSQVSIYSRNQYNYKNQNINRVPQNVNPKTKMIYGDKFKADTNNFFNFVKGGLGVAAGVIALL